MKSEITQFLIFIVLYTLIAVTVFGDPIVSTVVLASIGYWVAHVALSVVFRNRD